MLLTVFFFIKKNWTNFPPLTLNQIHRCQAKARWFYSLYSELQVVFGELEMVFEGRRGYLKIGPDNLGSKPET